MKTIFLFAVLFVCNIAQAAQPDECYAVGRMYGAVAKNRDFGVPEQTEADALADAQGVNDWMPQFRAGGHRDAEYIVHIVYTNPVLAKSSPERVEELLYNHCRANGG